MWNSLIDSHQIKFVKSFCDIYVLRRLDQLTKTSSMVVNYICLQTTDGLKLLDDHEVRIQLTYTSASGKRKGAIIQDLDNESLKSEEGFVALRTNKPESPFRAIFFKGNKFFQPRKEVNYTLQFWLRIVPNHQRSRLHTKKFRNLNEMLFLNRECSGDLKVNCQGELSNKFSILLHPLCRVKT